MTTPYLNGPEPNSYPGQAPQPPAVHYTQAPQPAPFGQNPGKRPGKASFGCGVAGLVVFGVVIVIGLVASVGAAMNQVATPEERKYVSRALWLNVIPVLVIVAAVLLFFLLSVVLSSAYAF